MKEAAFLLAIIAAGFAYVVAPHLVIWLFEDRRKK